MSEAKRFIYFPSLSAGSMVSAFKKDMKFESGDPVNSLILDIPKHGDIRIFWLPQVITTRKWTFEIKWV